MTFPDEWLTLTRQQFVRRAYPVHYRRGIWYSEMLAFLVWCRARGVEQIVESGIYEGQSTEILARFYAKTSTVAIDAVDRVLRPGVRERLQALNPRCRTLEGEAAVLVPALLDLPHLALTPTAVLLDGPKGEPAIELAERCFRHPFVQFVAIHDTYHALDRRVRNAAREQLHARGHTWSTDAPAYVRATQDLDAGYYEQWLDETGNGKLPYTLRKAGEDYPLHSYGPTLTFLFRRPEWRG